MAALYIATLCMSTGKMKKIITAHGGVQSQENAGFPGISRNRRHRRALSRPTQNSPTGEATNNPSDALLTPCRAFGLLQNGFYRRLQLRNSLWPVRAVRPGVKGKNRQRCREENHPEDQA